MIDSHYEQTYRQLSQGKDSIFEPCKILSFDTATMTASVYFLRSTREKDDCVVLFPSFSASNGMITIPMPETTALAFWGADRQVYILPAQFITPKYDLDNGVISQNASLEQYDKDLSMRHLNPGEVYHYGPGGHLMVLNNGDVELMGRELNHVRIEGDGNVRIGGRSLQVETETYSDGVHTFQADGIESQERIVTYYEIDEEAVREAQLFAREMTRLLTITEDPDVFDLDHPETRKTVFTERSGIVEDGDTGRAKRLPTGERVVKEMNVGGVTMSVGEAGTFRIERPDLTLDIGDAITVVRDGKRLTLDRLLERVETISALVGIEEDLYET